MTETMLEQGERRQVTALFYDMVGSTALLNRMDPEDFRDLQRSMHLTATRAIESHGGKLDLLMGDGGSAYFGYPVAHEDAARCAVEAGLAIVRDCRNLPERFGATLEVRVGIATGQAVFGPAGPGALAAREEIIGIAPTLAARLQAIAENGTVVVSNSTYSLTWRQFDYEALGAHPMKGFDRPQPLWRPLQPLDRESRLDTMRSPDQKLQAREEELARGTALWAKALSGHGQALFLHGEPGIGKSRLSKAIADRARDQGARVLVFQCDPSGQSEPFYPFVQALRATIHRQEPAFDFAAASPADFTRALDLPGAPSDGFFEALTTLFRPLREGAEAGHARTSEHDVRIVEIFSETLLRIARAIPCVLVLEDLHWADSQSQAVIEALLKPLADAHALMVVTSRQPPQPAWIQNENVTDIAVHRLAAGEISRLIASFAGAAPLDERLIGAIAVKSEGVPLFAEELTRFIIDRGADRPFAEAEWSQLFASDKTASLQDLLAARLATLGPARRVAQAASVIGRSFGKTVLVALLSDTGKAEIADEGLDRLLEAGFIEQRASPAGERYRFRHALLRQAAYEGLLRKNRQRLHEATYRLVSEGAKLRHAFSSAEVATHAEEAHLPAEAARHYLDAGRLAARRSGLKEARWLLQRALSQIELIEDNNAARQLELDIVMILGPVITTQDGAGAKGASELYDRGVKLLRAANADGRASGFPLYWGWWFTAPNFRVQRQRAEVLLSDLAGNQDREVELQVQHCRWATAFNVGAHNECLTAIETGLPLYSEDEALDNRTRYGGHDARVCGLGERALCSWFTGKTETAVSHLAEAVSWSDSIDHLGSRCHVLDIAIMLLHYRGETEQVARLAAEMRRLAAEHELKSVEAKSLIFGGWALGLTGQADRGREMLARGVAIQQEIGTEEDFPVYQEMGGELDALLGNNRRGIDDLTRTIDRAEGDGHAFWLPELYRRRALLMHLEETSTDDIVASLNHAIELSRTQGATVLELRALADLALIAPDHRPADWQKRIDAGLGALEAGEERKRLSEKLERVAG